MSAARCKRFWTFFGRLPASRPETSHGPISLTFSGTYKVRDDNPIEVTTRLLGQAVTRKYKAAVNGDKRTLTDTATGKADEYTRVP